ncbi:MAG: amidohydrolase [Acidimicrobiia bacterium]
MTDTTTIYPARRVITMNPAVPEAQAVAVRGDRVLGVGTVEELAKWGDHTVDDRFAAKVILPGFIEAHTHVMAGGVWQFPYVGFFNRRDPEGQVWSGCTTIDSVVDRLIEQESQMTDAGQPLIAWGLDPIYMPGERLVAKHLDRVSDTRPIFVYHASGHLATANSAMLERSEITEHTTTPGVVKDSDGKPNGELQEPAAMMLATAAFGPLIEAIGSDEAKWNYAYEARNSGQTLITDLGTTRVNDPEQVAAWRTVTDDDRYPARVMVAGSPMFGGEQDPHKLAQIVVGLESSSKLRFGIIKLVLDGSIQGFTARVSWPYYYDPPEGHPGNGLWLIPPDQVADMVTAHHEAGLTVHVHCNGDQAAQVFIDAVETALERHPRWDHRHTVQHCQLTTPAQYRKMAALGMCANIFSNHIFYWGDQHRDTTVGPERAARMDACATALREGVSFSIHSDSPITPMGHLHTAWCAVNRLTSTGQVLGPDERISVMDALASITIGGAYQLKLDHDMGSIEAGKLADFAILEDDPLGVDPVELRNIGVWGTVVGGIAYPAGSGG